MKIARVIALGLTTAASAPTGHAQTIAPLRVEVPVREVDLSDGTRRYAVPMTIGGMAIEAGMDTGSVGLRLLAEDVASAKIEATTHTTTYSYDVGTRFKGVVGKTTLAFGDATLSGAIPVDLIQVVDCRPDKPDCPARHVDPAKFGIQGNGLPGEGFKAIFGINMADDDVPNPLIKLGVRRWIIELPKPGDSTPGKLVLNPTADETQGYVMFPINPAMAGQGSGLHDSIDGCLVDEASHKTLCGAVVLDSGAPGIRVVSHDREPPWPNDDPAQIAFIKDGKPVLAAGFTVGRREQASRFISQGDPQVGVPHLFTGIMPYFAFDVLYDPEHGQVGLKAR